MDRRVISGASRADAAGRAGTASRTDKARWRAERTDRAGIEQVGTDGQARRCNPEHNK